MSMRAASAPESSDPPQDPGVATGVLGPVPDMPRPDAPAVSPAALVDGIGIEVSISGSRSYADPYREVLGFVPADCLLPPGEGADRDAGPGEGCVVQVDARELPLAENLLPVALTHAPHAMIIADERGAVRYANYQAARLFGCSSDEILDLGIHDIFAADQGIDVPELLGRVAASRHERCDATIVCRNGGRVEVVANWVALPAGGVLAELRDITAERRAAADLSAQHSRLEELVRQQARQIADLNAEVLARAQEAEAANRAKSVFLANMSHEIRTPLNTILGMAHILSRSAVDSRQSDQLAKIEAAGEHLLGILSDVLDLAKIETGKLVLQARSFTLAKMVESVVAIVRDNIAAKGLALRIDIGGVPNHLYGDATRLSQALMNYVSNALRFTERGGITVRARMIEDAGAWVKIRFEVIDSGIGLSREQRARLFRPFEQIDTSTTRRSGGTGLGLAISLRIAELMGGEVGVDSEPGHGSTFWFTARLERGHVTAEAGNSVDYLARVRDAHGGARILVAEDDPASQTIAVEMLRYAGLNPEAASNGLEALKRARESRYALILMDVQMPGMDGMTVAKNIRRMPGCSGIPILAMTGNVFEEDRRKCLDAGMNDFITKPVRPELFYAAINKWLRPSAT